MVNWKYTIPTKITDKIQLAWDEEDYDSIAAALLEAVKWIDTHVTEPDDRYVRDLMDDLEIYSAEDGADQLDYILDNFYDICDAERIWVEPFV